MLEREYKYYIDHKAELMERFNQRIIIIVGEEIKGDYSDYHEAMAAAMKVFKPGEFLLQLISKDDSQTVQRFRSRIFV